MIRPGSTYYYHVPLTDEKVNEKVKAQSQVVCREGNVTPLQYSCLENPMMESLVGCSPWDRKEWEMTEQLHFHFSLSCIGEGNGNPLQCSCLENPKDRGAWGAAVSGVSQSRTRLKRLSSSSSSKLFDWELKAQRWRSWNLKPDAIAQEPMHLTTKAKCPPHS